LEGQNLSYDYVCRLVGRLFIETQAQIDTLTRRAEEAGRERDAALSLLREKEQRGGQQPA
jgi:hypothetical protein